MQGVRNIEMFFQVFMTFLLFLVLLSEISRIAWVDDVNDTWIYEWLSFDCYKGVGG